MYLKAVDTGQRFAARQALKIVTALSPGAPIDVVKVLAYRPEYFGAPFCRVGHLLMRGPTTLVGWTVGERELFGAFTSTLNQCVF
jgi:hypothetical protein